MLIYRGGDAAPPFSADTRATPPHDLTDKSVLDDYPRGPGSDLLNQLMSESVAVFAEHPVNAKRRAEGHLPATNVWLWGQGRAPALPSFQELFGKTGRDDHGGRPVARPGRAGRLAADRSARGHRLPGHRLRGQGQAAIAALADVDLVTVHVEAPDEASHEGNAAAKIQALEEIDRHIVAPLHQACKRRATIAC